VLGEDGMTSGAWPRMRVIRFEMALPAFAKFFWASLWRCFLCDSIVYRWPPVSCRASAIQIAE